MNNFWGRKQYYVHAFSGIQDWFGDRGISLMPGDLKEWCYDGHFLYFVCGNSAPDEIKPSEGDDFVMVCVLDSLYYECYTELSAEDSPFANKLS